MRLLLLILHLSLASIPYNYMLLNSDDENQGDGLNSNMIIDIESINDIIFLSSSEGLGYSSMGSDGNFAFSQLDNESLPEGGNPALVIHDNIIAISGSVTVLHGGAYHPAGTGIAYSDDLGVTWKYMAQPIDNMPSLWSCSNYTYDSLFFNTESECEEHCLNCNGSSASCARIYDLISWGNQDDIVHLSVTTPINNVSYDLDIQGDYIYSTSWAGGLRRFNYTLINPVWESIPLPMDNQDELLCNNIDLSTYQLNPVGDCDSDYDNHKAFSIHSVNDTIWVGTAGGINKGIVNGACIDWTHLKSYENGFYDDWIIDFKYQILDNEPNRIWAITWNKDTQGSIGPPSFSNDGGQSWNYPNQLVELGVKSYNLSFNGNYIYLSTDQGLFLSQDAQFWEKFNDFIDYETNQQILSDVVYDSEVIDDRLWVGTQDGIAISDNLIDPDWLVYRFWEKNNSFSAYPNPFLRDSHNLLLNEGHVRFIYTTQNSQASIDIFDFSMDKVVSLNSPNLINDQIEFVWSGQTEYGDKVKNGVYFCRLNDNGKYLWVKLAVLGTL